MPKPGERRLQRPSQTLKASTYRGWGVAKGSSPYERWQRGLRHTYLGQGASYRGFRMA